MQQWLDAIAKENGLGRNTLKHIKSFLSAVFKVAKQQGYYMGENPVRDTAISPKATEPQETYAYSLDEIRSILRVLPETAGTAFAVAAFAGLRRGELQGMLWENYQDGFIRVTQAVWEGRVNEPKTRRSRGAATDSRNRPTSPVGKSSDFRDLGWRPWAESNCRPTV